MIAIIPTADRQRATVEVRVGFDELDARILPDMGVKVGFQENGRTEPSAGGVLIPATALRDENGRNYVYLVKSGVVERRAVTSGGKRGEEILVTAGLAGNETVIIGGVDGLADGSRVEETK